MCAHQGSLSQSIDECVRPEDLFFSTCRRKINGSVLHCTESKSSNIFRESTGILCGDALPNDRWQDRDGEPRLDSKALSRQWNGMGQAYRPTKFGCCDHKRRRYDTTHPVDLFDSFQSVKGLLRRPIYGFQTCPPTSVFHLCRLCVAPVSTSDGSRSTLLYTHFR